MSTMSLEIREGALRTQPEIQMGNTVVAITPAFDEDFWLFRVKLNEAGQAIVGFPKFFTIGIGFAQEEDWNTNLPFSCDARKIFAHISHNKGDDAITDEACIEAIEMVREAARQVMEKST